MTSPLIILHGGDVWVEFDLDIMTFRSRSIHGLAGASLWMVAIDLDENDGSTWTVVLVDGMLSGGMSRYLGDSCRLKSTQARPALRCSSSEEYIP